MKGMHRAVVSLLFTALVVFALLYDEGTIVHEPFKWTTWVGWGIMFVLVNWED